MNIIRFLESETKNFIDKPAIWEDGEEITHRELWQIVDKLAKAFLDIGIKEGDRIAICLPNCKEYIYAFLAALKINAIAVPLKQVTTSYEMKAILKDSHPSLLVADNVFINRMLPFDPSIEIGNLVICSKRIMRKGARRAVKIDDLFKKGTTCLGTAFSANNETVASINYTYRGYGYPLGAMLTHKNFRSGTDTYVATTGITNELRVGYKPGLSEYFYERVDPEGYLMYSHAFNDPYRFIKFINIQDSSRNPRTEEKLSGAYGDSRVDIWRLYLGMPQKYNTLGISRYQPAKSSQNRYYYKLNNENKLTSSDILQALSLIGKSQTIIREGSALVSGEIAENIKGASGLGIYTLSKNKDSCGSYISYYDLWDLSPNIAEGFFGTGIEIYDRIYYNPVTYEPLENQPAGNCN